MVRVTEYRVVSATEGHVAEYDNKTDAKERANEMNNEVGLPNDHSVEECTENY